MTLDPNKQGGMGHSKNISLKIQFSLSLKKKRLMFHILFYLEMLVGFSDVLVPAFK